MIPALSPVLHRTGCRLAMSQLHLAAKNSPSGGSPRPEKIAAGKVLW
jgi:hypothetical protein